MRTVNKKMHSWKIVSKFKLLFDTTFITYVKFMDVDFN